MDTPSPDPDDVDADAVVVPALLRAARTVYGTAVRERLAADGLDDLPRNGPYVVGGMVNQGARAGDLVRQLGVTKQAAGQLVDTLVVRGFLERDVDEVDRRRRTLTPTVRGRAAAAAVRAGVEEVDARLADRLGADGVRALRVGLLALCRVGDELAAGGHAAREEVGGGQR